MDGKGMRNENGRDEKKKNDKKEKGKDKNIPAVSLLVELSRIPLLFDFVLTHHLLIYYLYAD